MEVAGQLWEMLENRYYRKQQLYEMSWGPDMDLAKYIVAVGAMGGPIAMTRDPNLFIKVSGTAPKPSIDIYTASGRPFSQISWKQGRIVGLGWNDSEQLVVVAQDGQVYIFDVTGEFNRQFLIDKGVAEYGVKEVRMCRGGTGLVALTNTDQFFAILNFTNPRPYLLADIPDIDMEGTTGITSWAILSHERNIEVIAAANESLFVLDREKAWEPVLAESQLATFVSISVSANGKMLALFSNVGTLWVISTDFSENRMKYDVETQIAPRQLEWCGSDSIIAYWDQLGEGTDTILMVGPGGKWLNYSYDARVVVASEMDGLRIISQAEHEFVEAVPEVVERIFMIGSMSPGAMLNDARQDFDRKNPLADERIRDMKESHENPEKLLIQAVHECILAAGCEWDSSQQRSLLKAARFGKDFVDTNPIEFVEMCQTLRVLHHVRDWKVGIALTYRQFQEMGIEVLIDRLIARKLYWLAYEICEYLKLGGSGAANRVLVHWASSLIRNHQASDDEIAERIIGKLGQTKGISFAEIAQAAVGRPQLAIRLLEHEPRASAQVPLLLSMNEDSLALQKAIDSGDTDLAHLVVFYLREKTSGRGEFFRVISFQPAARDLFVQYCREYDPECLTDFYYTHDNHAESAELTLVQAYSSPSLEDKLEGFKKARDFFGKSPPHHFWAKATDDQVKLIDRQRHMTGPNTRTPLVGLPLGDTIYHVILDGDIDAGNKLRKEFKVPDRRYWWIKVKALAESRNWKELESFAKSKKSPIGYAPFVEECLAMNNRSEAKKYIGKIPLEDRCEYYLRVGDFESAIEVASACKDDDQFQMITAQAKGRRDILRLIDEAR